MPHLSLFRRPRALASRQCPPPPFTPQTIRLEPLESRRLLAATYAAIELGSLGGNDTEPLAINDLGQIVGFSTDSLERPHAFLWQKGVMTDLGLINNLPSSTARSINVNGVIAGSALLNATEHAVRFDPPAHSPVDLGVLSGGSSRANSINNANVAAGAATLINGVTHATVFTGDSTNSIVDLGTLGGFDSIANAINNAGQVAGWAQLASGARHAFLYTTTSTGTPTPPPGGIYNPWNASRLIGDSSSTPAAMRDLGTLGGVSSEATALNDAAQVAGFSFTAAGFQHAFFWQNGDMTDLGTLGGSSSRANGINASGQVVGQSNLPGDASTHGFIYQNGKMTDLKTLELPRQVAIQSATAISNAGWIVGTGGSPGSVVGLVLVPQTPSAIDNSPPMPIVTSAPLLLKGVNLYSFNVTYTDNVAVNAASFGNTNIVITGPHGFRGYATFARVDRNINGPRRVVTYTLKSPSAVLWNSADNGIYTIKLQDESISDVNGNFAPGGIIGKFRVVIPRGRHGPRTGH